MPQKRRTKAVRHSRTKPNMVAGNEIHGLTAQQKKEKLDILLSDFDAEVKERVSSMKEFTVQARKHIESAYMVELLQIPKHIRDMEVTDFLAAGGVISEVAMMDARKLVEVIANSVASKITQVDLKETEDKQVEATPIAQKKLQGKRKGNGKATMEVLEAPPTRSRRAKQLRTPAFNQKSAWEIPLVTPKFDPRLPVTPALFRLPKPGERIMSMAGSPLANVPKTSKHGADDWNIPLRGDKTLVIPSQVDAANLPILDVDAMNEIEKLYSHLAKLIDYRRVQQNA